MAGRTRRSKHISAAFAAQGSPWWMFSAHLFGLVSAQRYQRVCPRGLGLTRVAPSPADPCAPLAGTWGQALFTLWRCLRTVQSTRLHTETFWELPAHICGVSKPPGVLKPSEGPKTTAASLPWAACPLQGHCWGSKELVARPGPSHPWAPCQPQSQPSQPRLLVPEPAQPARALCSHRCRFLTGALGTAEVLRPPAAMGAHNSY